MRALVTAHRHPGRAALDPAALPAGIQGLALLPLLSHHSRLVEVNDERIGPERCPLRHRVGTDPAVGQPAALTGRQPVDCDITRGSATTTFGRRSTMM